MASKKAAKHIAEKKYNQPRYKIEEKKGKFKY